MIDNIPNGWKVEKLGNPFVATIIMGQSPVSSSYNKNKDGLPFYQGKKDFGEKYPIVSEYCNKPKKVALKEDILFCVRAPVGITNIATEECCIGRGLSAIRANTSNCSSQFLRYFFIKNERRISDRGRGSTFVSINKKDLEELKIPIPPLLQQEKIVKVLNISSLLIEKQKELIKKYDLFLKSKFIEMFGTIKSNTYNLDFEPLSNFGKIITGNTPPRKELENYDCDFIEWIKTDNISPNELYISKAKEYLSELGMSKGRTLEKGGLLITCIAGSIKSIGNVAMTNRKITFNQQINAIQPNIDINPLFLYWLIKLNKNYIHTFATKSMKKMISKGVFQEIKFIKPPIDLQNAFSKIASRIDMIKAQETQKLKHVEVLHSSLMDKAFKGEIS